MKLLVDTHVLIWWVVEPDRIPVRVRDSLRSTANNVFVSAGTGWEIATKVRIGKLHFPRDFLDNFDTRVLALAFEPLSITTRHAVTGAGLPGKHGDPFDRMLAGQAKCENLQLVSKDPAFKKFGVDTLW